MTNERKKHFNRWLPLVDAPTKIEIEAIHDDREGFRIILLGGIQRDCSILIQFDDPPIYRYCTENYQSLSLFEPGEWCFYRTEDSDVIRELHLETMGIYEGHPFVHYIILASNARVEVVTERQPIVNLLTHSCSLSI